MENERLLDKIGSDGSEHLNANRNHQSEKTHFRSQWQWIHLTSAGADADSHYKHLRHYHSTFYRFWTIEHYKTMKKLVKWEENQIKTSHFDWNFYVHNFIRTLNFAQKNWKTNKTLLRWALCVNTISTTSRYKLISFYFRTESTAIGRKIVLIEIVVNQMVSFHKRYIGIRQQHVADTLEKFERTLSTYSLHSTIKWYD